MSLLTYGCPDPTKGRTEEPKITTIRGTIWIDGDKQVSAKFDFSICNGVIENVQIFIKNRFSQAYDVLIPDASQFDEDFRNLLYFFGIQFEEINY